MYVFFFENSHLTSLSLSLSALATTTPKYLTFDIQLIHTHSHALKPSYDDHRAIEAQASKNKDNAPTKRMKVSNSPIAMEVKTPVRTDGDSDSMSESSLSSDEDDEETLDLARLKRMIVIARDLQESSKMDEEVAYVESISPSLLHLHSEYLLVTQSIGTNRCSRPFRSCSEKHRISYDPSTTVRTSPRLRPRSRCFSTRQRRTVYRNSCVIIL